MQTSTPVHLVTDHDLALARHQAARAVGRAGLTRDDVDDLAQQGALELCARIARFDPQRGRREAFVVAIARNSTARVVEERCAARRDWRRCRSSLQDEVATPRGSAITLADALGDDGPDPDVVDVALDVRAVVASLPEQLRAACIVLQRLGSTDAARALGVPRSTLHDITRRIRCHFEAAGLDVYVAPAKGAA